MLSVTSQMARVSAHAAPASDGVLGRVALGRRLTVATAGYGILFALLVANLTLLMVVDASTYQNMAGNNHTIAREAQSERGSISTYDGVTLAQSVEQSDGTYERVYPAGDLATHVVGYYSSTYGSSGIEAAYNDTLKGTQNYASWSDVLDSLTGSSTTGNDIVLTLNSKIQQAAQDAIDGYTGACVVIDPTTGAVLAMASSPTYDAQDAESVIAQAASSSNSGSSVLINRCTQALYAPGSTFKLITLAAAYENGVATPSSTYSSPGSMEIGNADVTNFKSKSYGTITVERAFELSSNTVFAQLGVELGAERLVSAATAFGFNTEVDFDLPLLESLMPDPDEMTTWETAWAAAGEPVGEHDSPAGPQATVLEMAMVGCAMANEGTIMQPYLVEGIYGSNGARSFTASPTELFSATSAEVAAQVLEAMQGVVESGTGTAAAVSGYNVVGKTGTAEHEGKENDSWFVGYADADSSSKNVVVAIMLEEVGSQTSGAKQAQQVFKTALSVM
jgi:peptidoglycan glycosyltransferase